MKGKNGGGAGESLEYAKMNVAYHRIFRTGAWRERVLGKTHLDKLQWIPLS